MSVDILAAIVRLRTLTFLSALALIAAVVSGASARPPAAAPVPPGFVGVNAGGPLFDGQVDITRQLDLMVSSGVQSIRVVIDWPQLQPYANWADVPSDQRSQYINAGGVPTNFTATDTLVRLAAQRGLSILPIVLYAPSWDAGKNPSGGFAPPARTAPYAQLLAALIGRYGPRGTFWRAAGPKLPIRMWQVWNEPNLSAYWPQPFAKSYVALLHAAHTAIKRADPGAKVVLGAITNTAWKYIRQIYNIRGAGKLFDIAAVNGFTSSPQRVIEYLQFVRRALIGLGDPHKPLMATELSFPSAVGHPVNHFDWDTTVRGQATRVGQLLPLLAAYRQSLVLQSFYYFTWVGQENAQGKDDFNFAGLLRVTSSGQVTAKPALGSYRAAALRLEGCRSKRLATHCDKKG